MWCTNAFLFIFYLVLSLIDMSSLLYYISSFMVLYPLFLKIKYCLQLLTFSNTYVLAAGMANLELIDPVIDAKHRSYLVDGQLPPALRLRTHDECWSLDARWLPSFV